MTDVQISIFIVTSLIVIITPGQDMILVMSRAISQGAKAGIVTAAGVSTGLLGHTLLAAFGLGSLLMASQTLFIVLKIVGAGYLIYLGIRLLLKKESDLDLTEKAPTELKKLFSEGAFSNIANPKIAIFYFAFLPQFFSADVSQPAQFLLLLGVLFAVLTFLVKGPVGYFAGYLSAWLRSRPSVLKWIDRTSGMVLIGLGVKLAFEKRS